ncbi:FCD domain-containing protein [Marinobacter sp. F3R08]|uniref:FCD domain-containing protein n=1 Tax=Marinobacter sp. F3R08 TaxID=2841559 RepID=UPI002B1CB38F|nr:FCD domain-containing protein [Marinobacter sp. F3R08]
MKKVRTDSKPLPISHSIAHQIETMILDGSLTPKQKIPSERQLSSRLGVSRSIVREALRELQGRGVIETRHGQGSFVAEIVPEPEDQSPLLQLFFTHSRLLYDLYEVREQLEGQATYLAAQRGTEKDFYRITKAFKALESADLRARAELDHAFHRSIVEASHNPVLVHILSSLNQLILHSVQTSVSNLPQRPHIRQQIDKHHRQVYNAVINRQPQRAEKAATTHIRHVSKSVREFEKQEQRIFRDAIQEPALDAGTLYRP